MLYRFFEGKFWHVRNPLLQINRLRLSVFVHDRAGWGEGVCSTTSRRPQMEKHKLAHLSESLPYDHCPVTQHA